MPVNFDDAIPFSGEWVAAMGPEHPQEKIREICVWIYQSLPDCAGDAAATEMTTHRAGENELPHFVRIDGEEAHDPGRWLLPVKKVGADDFRAGRAHAIAIALIEDVGDGNKPRVEWWNQQVELQPDEEGRVEAAIEAVHAAAQGQRLDGGEEPGAVLRGEGTLAEPLEFKGL
jgi:hypothetical protein